MVPGLHRVEGGEGLFTGFFQPINNLPTLNTMKAGAAVPRSSLSGDKGLNILAAWIAVVPNDRATILSRLMPWSRQ